MAIRAELTPRGPYSLRVSGRHTSDATRVVADGTYRATFRNGETLERVHAAQRRDGTIVVAADSEAGVEHVAGGRDGQRQFVHELCRVSKRVFVTTPNRFFPLEVHTLLPFAHWLPEAQRARAVGWRGFHDVLDPLGPRELASLFPYRVRVLNRGMTLIAVGPE